MARLPEIGGGGLAIILVSSMVTPSTHGAALTLTGILVSILNWGGVHQVSRAAIEIRLESP